ncbi:MAG: long-chain fatty acid--CoA ligase [Gammaproteobacteria bacterium]|jgi:acyl-CoA synthetase (AMP-forming)/AMP-acid ligase II|nr:2-succinylbenzoyl-CoA synthetase [Gammaproteobacteria bacterium]MDP6096725.1 long-chain fatty acid--CoA ligase [Gammaproteobacteria bacterium]MDP7455502.1 long-chain fatty acid--CoA ligase [Gammaproteobacteria bacterium]|tara:strand:- start:1550 stop:3097 length:1548 start_codon:yes stop_codon:yes gene_type:complete
MKNNIGLLLSKRALINPDREAFVDSKSGLRLSFSELNARCNRLVSSLLALGVKPGDRIAVAMMNSAEFIEAYFAIAKLGAIIVPLNWRLVPDELEFILKDSGSSTLIFGEEFVDVMSELHSRGAKTDVVNWIQHAIGDGNSEFTQDYMQFRDAGSDAEPVISVCEDELLYIMYTSGTTGLPKGVVHSHNTCFWALFTFGASCDLRDADRYLVALPLFHVGSLTPVTLNIYRGVTSVVMREFDPIRAWQLIQEEQVTNSLLVPAMLNFMVQVPDVAQYDYSSLRWVQSGASPLPVNLIQQYADMGIDIHQIYGLTESCGPACVINAESALSKIGSTGRAFFHTEVRVVDEAGKDCPPGEQGEVWVRGKHVMLKYWNRPDATAETITREGWLRTGDVASIDDEGFVYIQDRIKDMIISGGENVYPAEIENVILSHPEVGEVAVIGQPSEIWGESPFAVVVKNTEQLTEADVLAHCEGKMAGFKLPKGAAFIDVIPRNANGKVLKRELRLQFPGPSKA